MKSLRLSFIILFSLLFIYASHAQTKRALIIGIDKYKPADPKFKTLRTVWSNLDGCVNDAISMKNIMEARYGFKDKNVITLLDSTGSIANKKDILAAFDRLIKETKPGDVVLFYYAGHGSRVKNSLSPEMDKRDETIVPSDAWRSTEKDLREIRDKEMAKLIQKLADKKAILTFIFDSCHSGSIGRGAEKPKHYKARFLQPLDNIDVADATPAPQPEKDKGVLILSAAQDFQTAQEYEDDNGIPHGAFTAALLKVLRSCSVNESVTTIFRRVKAIMQSDGSTQEPVIAGTKDRREQNLLGVGLKNVSGKTLAGILKNSSGDLELQGGYAIGLAPGTELVRVQSDKNSKKVRIQVTEVESLNKSLVKVIEGGPDDINAGDLFAVDKWTSSSKANLRIWIPEPGMKEGELYKFAEQLESLRAEKNIKWITDPTVNDPNFEIIYENKNWVLINFKSGKTEILGKVPDADKLKNKFNGEKVKLFVCYPPDKTLYNSLYKKFSDPASTVILSDAKSANYILAGRYNKGKFEYAFIQPGISSSDTSYKSTMPVRTDWLEFPTKKQNETDTKLFSEFAYKLGKIRAWLTLEAPPDDGSFPYKFYLKNSQTGEIIRDGKVYNHKVYGIVLELDSLLLKNWDREGRFVYIFGIDKNGNSSLLFPSNASSVENRMPPDVYPFPKEIQIGRKRLFRILPPFGYDTYVMLTSADAITDPTIFNSTGVRTRGETRSVSGNPLTKLLGNVGTSTRSPAPIVPSTWSIQRSTIQSLPNK